MAIADRIAILDNGNIQQYNTPDMLYEYPANLFVAKFMGNPPMNSIDTVIKKEENGCAYIIGDCQIPISSDMIDKIEIHAGKKEPAKRMLPVSVLRLQHDAGDYSAAEAERILCERVILREQGLTKDCYHYKQIGYNLVGAGAAAGEYLSGK